MTELTRNQNMVLNVLKKSDKPVSAYEILDQLRPQGLKAPLQIYRALEKLIEFHLAHKLESLNAYVTCSDDTCHKDGVTAFSICRDCRTVEEIATGKGEQIFKQFKSAKDFQVESTVIELHGLCRTCS